MVASEDAWEKFVDDDTKTPYYYNKSTGESSWDVPEGYVERDGAAEAASGAPANPPKWRKYVDDKLGKPYYYDEANEVTQWEEPDGFADSASGMDCCARSALCSTLHGFSVCVYLGKWNCSLVVLMNVLVVLIRRRWWWWWG